MEIVGSVLEAWRYPVKSMQGERLAAVECGPQGVVGDRRYAVVEPEAGRALSAKTVPELLDAAARTDPDGSVGISLPDGARVMAGRPEADEAVSDWLGRRVQVREAEAGAESAYEMTFDPPDDSAERVEIPTPEGTFFDLAALHVISVQSLAECRTEHPEGDWDRRRFRPNLLLDIEGNGFVENGWVGEEVQLGGVVAQVQLRTVRCAMPLRAQPAGPGGKALDRDVEVFRTMNRICENHLGVYCAVRSGGRIITGDAVGQ